MPAPESFARQWADAWNRHDIEAVLQHFHEDVRFTSPVAAQVMPETGGVLEGKAALRAYWSAALARLPDLRFTVEGVYAGVDTIVIAYRNHAGVAVSEVLRFADGRVIEGHGTYPADAADPAGLATRPPS